MSFSRILKNAPGLSISKTAALYRIISSIAVLTSLDSVPSGATEKNRLNAGSKKNNKIKRTAMMNVFPFLRAISRTMFVYFRFFGFSR